MQSLRRYDLKPKIVLSEADHRKLIALALAGSGHSSDAADDLLYEIERARVVPETKLAASVVRMGSTVTYRPDNGPERTVTLVYPADADIADFAGSADSALPIPQLHKSAPPIFPAGGMAATAPMSRPAVLSVKPWTVQSRDPGNAAGSLPSLRDAVPLEGLGGGRIGATWG